MERSAQGGSASKPTVFIHTNYKQLIGARVSRHSLLRHSPHRSEFDVKILLAENQPALMKHAGDSYLRDGRISSWDNDDLQSFTPLRFLPAQEMSYSGRAVVIDPDIFAFADVWDLLERDMQGKAILCRRKDAGRATRQFDSSVMVLDCARLAHWRFEEAIEEMFAHRRDYRAWIALRLEDEQQIGSIEAEWNDYDRFTPETKLLHNTRRLTQPWKTGLPIDFRVDPPRELGRKWGLVPRRWIRQLRLISKGQAPGPSRRYRRHPDPAQERCFFASLALCLDENEISGGELQEAIRMRWVRPDILRCVDAARADGP